jgi:hypothetical protein
VYKTIVSYLHFYNDDGTVLLQTAECKNGVGAYTGATPTKASTAQYDYTFVGGWSLTPGGSVDPNALKNVIVDRNVYAVFTATIRKYTVTWKNYDGTTLEVDVLVPYGTVPTYNSEDPTHADTDYVWEGNWSPAVKPITGDTTYVAKFKYTGVYYTQLIDRSITEITSNVAIIRPYAFFNCIRLNTVDLPVVTNIGARAFQSSTVRTLILRSNTVVPAGDKYVCWGTPIKNGDGYIYVPRNLVDSYKSDSNWSTYATQFRAIEDYPEITGGGNV